MDLKEGDYIRLIVLNNEILLKKVEPICPLSSEDPFWKMVGIGESGTKDGSINHDHYLAEGECKRWKKNHRYQCDLCYS